MPVRIYALAKELSVDSKELVEICRKAGIPGKGSALASLDDNEVAKLKAYLGDDKKAEDASGPTGKGARTRPEEPTVYTRDDYIAPGQAGKVPVLDLSNRRKTPQKPKEEPKEERKEELGEEPKEEPKEEPREEPKVEKKEEKRAPERPPKKEEPKEEKKVEHKGQKEDDKDDRRKGKTDAPKPPRKKRAPVIKLAQMPEAKQPKPKPKPAEPKAQKPEIRLPKHAIKGHKAGRAAPLEHLTKAAEKQKKKAGHDKKKPGKAATKSGGEAPLSSKTASKRRRRPAASGDQADRGLAGMASARADRQKSRKTRSRDGKLGTAMDGDRDSRPARRPRTLTRRRNVNTAAPRKEKVALELPCTVRTFSEASGIAAGQLLKTLMGIGVSTLNINAQIDEEVTELLASELGVELEFKHAASLEEKVIQEIEEREEDEEALALRPPVVTFLGHVDHGKTSLLDRIIGTNVVAGEAGGITQHIRAYEIAKDGRKIAFVDTPGHEAFTEMRARGANVTDIAVLVIAADDGIMPQTEEAISHAKAAEVPIIVALNKIDLPGANPDRALQQLAAQELLPSEWGGDVEVIKTSATTGEGMDDLLETILVTAELHEYKANPNRSAVGICLEAEQEAGRGVIAKLIVQSGTMSVGDVIVCGAAHGRVKAMYDTLKPRTRVKKAGPSTPVNVTGLDRAPDAGDRFYVLDDISQARTIAESRADRSRQQSLAGVTTRVSFGEFQRRLSEGDLADEREVVTLNLIVRADVRGSIEAIEKELSKLDHPEVDVRILHKSVGAITAADVMLAHASQAVIVGFNVIPDEAARPLADEKDVEIRRYDVIYKVTDDVKATLEGKLKPEERVVELGHALVKRVFPMGRVARVAGCYVIRGMIARGCRVRVSRDGRTIGDYELESLRHEKDDVKEVPRGMECGMKLASFNDVKQDDVLEAYKIEEVARTL